MDHRLRRLADHEQDASRYVLSGGWRLSGGGGGSRILKKLVLIPPATTAVALTPCSLPSACSACVKPMTPCLEAAKAVALL